MRRVVFFINNDTYLGFYFIKANPTDKLNDIWTQIAPLTATLNT